MTSAVCGNREALVQQARRLGGRWLWTLALAGLLLVSTLGPERVAAASKPNHHIYCIRGVFNVFSLGMDEICSKASKMGLSTSVHNHAGWAGIATEAAENYKAGRIRNIILIGHSAGAGAVADITARLGEIGIPVKLAVELDCIWATTASGRVEQFINYYVATGAGKPVTKGPRFSGALRNIDLSKDQKIGHMNIDKDPTVQAKVLGHIRQALAGPSVPKQEPAAAGAAIAPQKTTGSGETPGNKVTTQP